MAVIIPDGLRAELEEPFGGPGDPAFRLSDVGLAERGAELHLSGVLSVDLETHSERWRITLAYPDHDAAYAAADATPAAHAWFARLVMANVAEWWHTRRTEPNIPLPPVRIG